MYRMSEFLVATLLVLALGGGGFVHAAVPHDEGDHHASSGIVWGSLHSALSHEDKFFALTAVYLFVFAVLLTGVRSISLYVPVGIEAKNQKREELRRGTAKYRRFG
jgi:hypothetical protein